MYHDGLGLYLQVGHDGGAKSWIFRYHVEGRGDRQMGLGPLHTVGLAEARERARQARLMRLDGIDPIENRKAKRLAQKLEASKQVTFEICAKEWMDRNSGGWVPKNVKGTKNRALKRLRALGKLPVRETTLI